jgi:hypothetical protein
MHNDPQNSPPPDPAPSGDARISDRIQAIEEALGYASHEADQLKAHFLALTRALESLERRVNTLESRLASGPQSQEPDSLP